MLNGKIYSSIPTEVKLIVRKVDLLFVTYNGSGYSYPDFHKRFREMTLNDFNILWNGKTTKGEVVSERKFRNHLNNSIKEAKKINFDFHNESLGKQIIFMEEVWESWFEKRPVNLQWAVPQKIKKIKNIEKNFNGVAVCKDIWRLQ